MAFDSHITKSPSWMTGTMALGLLRQQLRIGFDVLEVQVELGAGPQHLADVDRGSSSEHLAASSSNYFGASIS